MDGEVSHVQQFSFRDPSTVIAFPKIGLYGLYRLLKQQQVFAVPLQRPVAATLIFCTRVFLHRSRGIAIRA